MAEEDFMVEVVAEKEASMEINANPKAIFSADIAKEKSQRS